LKNLFSYDNWFFRGMTKLVLLIVVNAMFVICSIPIFTFGASYSGLYYAINKNLKFERGYAFRCFWEGFKDNFKQSTLANLLFLLITLIILGDTAAIQTLSESGRMNIGFQLFFYILLGFVWLYATWVFAYVSIFENKLKNVFKNCLILFFAEFPTTFITALILVFVGVVIYIIPYTVLIMPGVGVWLVSYRMQKSFRKYMSDEEKEKSDELNHL